MTFGADARVLVFEPATGHSWLVITGAGVLKHKGLGVIDTDKLVAAAPGDRITYGAKDVVLLKPTVTDLAQTLRRKAQIITAKDASRIVYELGIGAGDRVLESGIGSGATTIALAWGVGAEGRVVVQELRQDFADWATENLERAELASRVDVQLGDLTEGAAEGVEGPFDAVLLDQPRADLALPNVAGLLAPGARVACYCPQVDQMMDCHRVMESLGFAGVRSLELIQRDWVVKEHGARPAFDGLGHTAFLVLGRFMGPSD